jgi:uncharacterized coiled-coil protein SlyX
MTRMARAALTAGVITAAFLAGHGLIGLLAVLAYSWAAAMTSTAGTAKSRATEDRVAALETQTASNSTRVAATSSTVTAQQATINSQQTAISSLQSGNFSSLNVSGNVSVGGSLGVQNRVNWPGASMDATIAAMCSALAAGNYNATLTVYGSLGVHGNVNYTGSLSHV